MTTTPYLLLLWGDPDACFDTDAAYAAHGRFAAGCAEQGHELLGGEELTSPSSARVLRVDDGGTQITDGPYAETTEQLGGFYRVRTSDPDGLLRLAAPLVADDGGTLELRPEVTHDDAGDEPGAGDEPATRPDVAATYLLLLRGDPSGAFDLDRVFAAHDRFTEGCGAQGHEIVGGEELGPHTAARLLRATPHVVLSDGPYAETTEQLGGYYLVRTSDPDALLRLAAPLVEVEGRGSVELRAVATAPAGVAS